MKKLLSCLLLFTTLAVQAQVYNNEWIDHNKTYYKFKVGRDGWHRIQATALQAAGLGNVPADHFQLWRNGVEVPIIAPASGSGTGALFIDFWGKMNDGKPDKALYRDPAYQLNEKWSLQTDTAVYFLTVNPAGNNKRLVETANNVAGNNLPAEPYFMHTVGRYFRDRINGGYAINVGQLLYSSSYDKGEGWTSNDIRTGEANTQVFNDLYVASGGPDAKFKIGVSGNALYPRFARIKVNGDSVLRFPFDFYNYTTDSVTFPSAKIASGSANIEVANICNLDSCVTIDRMVIHYYELTYPRQFHFGNAASFEFSLPASAAGNYLEIKGFNNSGGPVRLIDLTNGRWYSGDISTPGIVKVVLQPSATPRQLVLHSLAAFNEVGALQPRQFTNYANTNNQADYLIISNQRLFTGAGGVNPVEDYRAYRSSNTGGAFNARVFDIDELVDQFAFGIKKHPLAVRNFVLFARRNFIEKPKHLFIIGRGLTYQAYRTNESNASAEALNLVPTYGMPASDALFTSDPGSSLPQLSYGRLPAVNANEVAIYLAKVKESELAQATLSPNRQDREWMKNVVHINGISDPDLKEDINSFYQKYKNIISDTLFGAKVTTFSKTSVDAVQQITSSLMPALFREGISLITYFGHSSSSTLDFNLESPESYQNQGKYPLFIALGCYVGDFFTFSTNRLNNTNSLTLSEKYTLAPGRGTIGFVASTHYGIVHYLDVWNTQAYKAMVRTHYGSSIGDIIKVAARDVFNVTSQEDFYSRSNVEQIELNGDPAIKVNPHAKPDYLIEESFVKLSPEFISIAENDFQVSVKVMNIGKAVADSIWIEVKREYPNQSSEIVFRKQIPGIRYVDSVSFVLPIDAIRDKGINKLTITVDADENVDEFYETNNTITKEFVVFEDEIRPVYPYNFSIVNRQGIKLVASTANAFSSMREYKMEIDTTELFNSPLKISKTISSIGGVIEFDPGLIFSNNQVYYWRVAEAANSSDLNWRAASFIFLQNHDAGFNQSHIYQHLKSKSERVNIDSNSFNWKYDFSTKDIFVQNGVYPTASAENNFYNLSIDNGAITLLGGCYYDEVIINVIDPLSFKPWKNSYNSSSGLYNSLRSVCSKGREFNFEFLLKTSEDRKKAMDFIDMIPAGAYVVIRTNAHPNMDQNTYVNAWKADTSLFGAGNSLYHKLYNQGFANLDSFNRPRAWIFVFKKDDPTKEYTEAILSNGIADAIRLTKDFKTQNPFGQITSPFIGPATKWKEFQWHGSSLEVNDNDNVLIQIIGRKADGSVDTLENNIQLGQHAKDISDINAAVYPYLQLHMQNIDTTTYTPYQLGYWRLTYDPVPEGALAPNIYLSMKDTVEVGEPLEFKVAFKNVSPTPFDSVLVKLTVIDRNNVPHLLQNYRYKPLSENDTLTVVQPIDTKQFIGLNSLFLDINPANDQPEQYHFNNFAYKNFYVISDTLNPFMDVTFDNVHILNNDIISPKPDILIKLKDEAKWNLLNDTSLVNIRVRYPDGSTRPFYFNNTDTLRFNSAQSRNDNTATINFRPYFNQDGTYELTVSGKDKSDNKAGALDYKVTFEVYNKSMISNMLNYPNPFTTSTAFVFTLTGSEVPQEFKIQILTVTGKIVKEITRQELGPLKIGRNITEYKWDGTDQYGQKLANGVYLYRVITSIGGKSLEKFNSKNESENTDKYFNKGYGKMYLMR